MDSSFQTRRSKAARFPGTRNFSRRGSKNESLELDLTSDDDRFKDELYEQLESNRGEIGKWLWPLNKVLLPERHPTEDSAKAITSPDELHDYYLGKTKDATKRSFHPITHDGQVVGLLSCGIHNGKPGEIQYWLGKKALGKRVMTNALTSFKRNAPKLRSGINELAADIEDQQFASRQVFRQHAPVPGFSVDPVPPEWLKARHALIRLNRTSLMQQILTQAMQQKKSSGSCAVTGSGLPV